MDNQSQFPQMPLSDTTPPENKRPPVSAQVVVGARMDGSRDRPTTEPGGCECMSCGCIFIGDEAHTECAVCTAAPPPVPAPESGPLFGTIADRDFWVRKCADTETRCRQLEADLTAVISDTAKELGCEPDNEAILETIAASRAEVERLEHIIKCRDEQLTAEINAAGKFASDLLTSCPKEGRFTLTLERMPDGTFRPITEPS